MLTRLLELLVCPACKQEFSLKTHLAKGQNIISGLLICPCGKEYRITNSIPRILPNSPQADYAVKSKDSFEYMQSWTKKSFGYQWSIFKNMSEKFEDNFLSYIYPMQKTAFKGKLGLDAGCGFGRHIFYAARFGAEMVGIDLSSAIDSTYENTKHLPNIHLVQCDIYNLPFRKESFDFVYSIGVLHHLPNPEAGFKNLSYLLKKNASILVWVYSSTRRFTNFLIEVLRKITRILPLRLILFLSFIMACLDWGFFILPYKLLVKLRIPQRFINLIVFARIRLYAQYPFEVSWADWFDRLSPPIRFYYNEQELRKWFENMKMGKIKVSQTGLYGWRGYGEREK